MKYSVVFVLIILTFIGSSVEYIAGQSQPTCYGRDCPVGTTSCKKHMKSSLDRKLLEITVNCLDDFNGSLKEYFFEELSTLNPYTHYESTSYSGTGDIGIGGNSMRLGRYNNGLEDFS
ncbi:uncharacterized protein [Leptinotarsa decemlineata]|uniref:uncharacterized protein n=1 Tax=Leptinotarsa decemlineata TaxID=7539 RepID=UPI003D3065C0